MNWLSEEMVHRIKIIIFTNNLIQLLYQTDLLQCVLLFMLTPAWVSRPTPNPLRLFYHIAATVLLVPLKNG